MLAALFAQFETAHAAGDDQHIIAPTQRELGTALWTFVRQAVRAAFDGRSKCAPADGLENSGEPFFGHGTITAYALGNFGAPGALRARACEAVC